MNEKEFEIYMNKCKVPMELKDCIRRNRQCFAKNISEIGILQTNPPTEFTLKLKQTWDHIPFSTEPYKQSPEKQEAIDKYVKEQLEAGKIEPVKELTGWNHSCIVASKKDNEITGSKNRYRVCVDYKPINAVTEKIGFSIPSKEDIVESIGQWDMYITIDISTGHYLAFSTKNGEKYQP